MIWTVLFHDAFDVEFAQLAEDRRFVQVHAAADRNGEQHCREQEWNAPAPGSEIGVAQQLLEDDDLQRRGHHAERPHQLQDAGVKAAPAGRRVRRWWCPTARLRL